ncbi:tyrosine-type recombinase/integrase [Candidatus Woesearchaeota archaeon]|nr:tyrosine-type recombinase/integrase [Candidatus Woesearchaeota archaeon]
MKRNSFYNKTPMENLETELVLRGYSKETIKSYIHYNRQFLDFISKSPKYVYERDIKDFVKNMIDLGLDKNTINLAISALLFYYKKIMHRKFYVPRLKKDKKMYPVLSEYEVMQIIESADNMKHKLLLKALYSTGLRVSEAAKLQMADIDFDRNIGYVRKGKGQKDRLFSLSYLLVEELKEFFEQEDKKAGYLFSSGNGPHYTSRTIQEICRKYTKKAGIQKNVTPHTFRRSFATHLIEDGCSIYDVQRLLGHANVHTTQEYIKQSKVPINKIENPLDRLYSKTI